jgi:hypothetical protein
MIILSSLCRGQPLLTAVLVAASVSAAGAQTRVVRGVVQDGSNTPLAGVTVQARDVKPVTTDDSGRFRLELPNRKSASLDVRRVGLMPSRFNLGEGGDTSITILLVGSAQTLEPVDVRETALDRTLEATGFSQRYRERQQGTNLGHFITAKDIEQRNPSRMCPLFETLPGFGLGRPQQPGTCFLTGRKLFRDPRPPIGAESRLIACPMTVFLDGQRLNVANMNNGAVDIDALVLPMSVAGVEYYTTGARIPSKYSMIDQSCGLVLVWTKRGG